MKARIKSIVDGADPRYGKPFDLAIQSLIVFSLVSFSVETLPSLDARLQAVLSHLEMFIVGVFTVEYLLRIWVADRKLAYVFSFYGIVDLIAIAPFYLQTTLDLRGVRVFRLFRLLRIFKLKRFTQASRTLALAFYSVRTELVLFFFVAMQVLFVSAVGIYYLESEAQPEHFGSVFHALWWSIATLTTVGYGDVYPVTVGGKAFTGVVVLVGIGLVAVPSGLLASALTELRIKEPQGGGREL